MNDNHHDPKRSLMSQITSGAAIPVVVLVIILIWWAALSSNPWTLFRSDATWVSYSAAMDKIGSGDIQSATVDTDRHVLFLESARSAADEVPSSTGAMDSESAWLANIPAPVPGALWAALSAHKIDVRVVPVAAPSAFSIQSILLGLIVGGLAVAWIFTQVVARRQAGPRLPAGFQRDGARFKPVAANDNSTRLADLVGCEGAREEASEFISYLKAPQRYLRVNATLPRGVLVVGPPGTGKTMLARAIAGEAGVPFFSVSGSDFVEMFVGVGAARVRELFAAARAAAPAIIFIDEMDAVGRARSSGRTGGAANDEREQTLNQLLVEMQGFSAREGVIVLAATNRPDILDKALLRPGRFDRRVHLDLPDRAARKAILEAKLADTPVAADVNLESVAAGTPGMSGADLANLVNEAAVRVARRDALLVGQEDLEWARDKVLMGLERKGGIRSRRDREMVAFHEAGHAIVAHFTPHADPVHKITIIPRGGSLGLTAFLPDEERVNQDLDDLRAALRGLMGGRAAESVALGTMTAGASNDLARATLMARRMVAAWGMDASLGPVAVDADGDYGQVAWSDTLRAEVDDCVRRELNDALLDATTCLVEHRALLNAVAAALLDRETLSSEEFVAMAGPRNGKQAPGGADGQAA